MIIIPDVFLAGCDSEAPHWSSLNHASEATTAATSLSERSMSDVTKRRDVDSGFAQIVTPDAYFWCIYCDLDEVTWNSDLEMEIATLCLKLRPRISPECVQKLFSVCGACRRRFASPKKYISGFWGDAQFEEIALLLIFGHIWLQIEIAMSLFLQPSLK